MTTPINMPPGAPAGSANEPAPGAAGSPPRELAAPGSDSTAASAELTALREQVLVDRFDAVAARAGIDESYTEVALELFRKTGDEATKENLAKFCASLKKSRPALFGPQPAQTAPKPTQAAPAAPAPGVLTTPFQQWRSLLSAGRKAEASAFYQKNRRAISRTAT